VRRSPAPGALQLAPPPAWPPPRVRQDHGRSPTWTLLHLRLTVRAAELCLDFPEIAVGADVDITARKPDVTIPPVMLNSHVSNLGHRQHIGTGQSCETFSPGVRSPLSDPVVFGCVTCATATYLSSPLPATHRDWGARAGPDRGVETGSLRAGHLIMENTRTAEALLTRTAPCFFATQRDQRRIDDRASRQSVAARISHYGKSLDKHGR
jgi:hypothetical protein